MPDVIDDAQAREAQYLAHCLAGASPRPPDGPQERDGQGRIVCAECGEPISPARLASVPTAIRCAPCQGEKDGRR